MTDPQLRAFRDQYSARIAGTIRTYGLFIQFVGKERGDRPPSFAYTVGLFGYGHPELVVTAVDPGTASGLLNHLGGRIRDGDNLVPGQLLEFEEWPHRVVVEELPNPGEIVLAANAHYQRPPEASLPAYQLTYDDLRGRFPWDAGYADDPGLQPRPGTWRA